MVAGAQLRLLLCSVIVVDPTNALLLPLRPVRSLARASGGQACIVDEGEQLKLKKAVKAMTGFANSYCKNTGTAYCTDASIPSVVIKGLAEHKITLGAPLCPCRHYENKEAEAKDGYWNCPCVPMRERHECHCMLFLTPDNEFAGEQQSLTVDEVDEHTKSAGSMM